MQVTPPQKDGKQLVLVGAGELAAIANEYFEYDSPYTVAAFAVEREYREADSYLGKPLIDLENLAEQYPPNQYDVFVAVPASQVNRLRKRLYEQVKQLGYLCATYISSYAFVWRNVEVGENCFIFEHNTVQPFVKIGNNVILWSGNHIGHQTVIKDHAFVTSHAVISGYCSIGEGCFVGVNSTFNDQTSLADWSIVGSGSLVNKALEDRESLYIGAPAKKVEGRSAFDIKL